MSKKIPFGANQNAQMQGEARGLHPDPGDRIQISRLHTDESIILKACSCLCSVLTNRVSGRNYS